MPLVQCWSRLDYILSRSSRARQVTLLETASFNYMRVAVTAGWFIYPLDTVGYLVGSVVEALLNVVDLWLRLSSTLSTTGPTLHHGCTGLRREYWVLVHMSPIVCKSSIGASLSPCR